MAKKAAGGGTVLTPERVWESAVRAVMLASEYEALCTTKVGPSDQATTAIKSIVGATEKYWDDLSKKGIRPMMISYFLDRVAEIYEKVNQGKIGYREELELLTSSEMKTLLCSLCKAGHLLDHLPSLALTREQIRSPHRIPGVNHRITVNGPREVARLIVGRFFGFSMTTARSRRRAAISQARRWRLQEIRGGTQKKTVLRFLSAMKYSPDVLKTVEKALRG
jgi:hypothetical protein